MRCVGFFGLPKRSHGFEINHDGYSEISVRDAGEVFRRRWVDGSGSSYLNLGVNSSMSRSTAHMWEQVELAIERLLPVGSRSIDEWSEGRAFRRFDR